MGELFKKSGRVPKMNVKMKELRELEISLKEEQEKVAEYAPSISRIHEIDEQLIHCVIKKAITENNLTNLHFIDNDYHFN